MVYEINGIPVCGITFNFFSPGNGGHSSLMLSHGSIAGNEYTSRANWIRLPFPIKVYALSITTDGDDESGVNMTFQVRKDTGNTYTNYSYLGEANGSSISYTSLDERHHESHIFSDQPTFATGDSIGLETKRTGGSGEQNAEYTIKLWCYQI
jgi:hypothetical protein